MVDFVGENGQREVEGRLIDTIDSSSVESPSPVSSSSTQLIRDTSSLVSACDSASSTYQSPLTTNIVTNLSGAGGVSAYYDWQQAIASGYAAFATDVTLASEPSVAVLTSVSAAT